MYSTVALRKFRKLRFTTESNELISSVLLKRKSATQSAALSQQPKKMLEISVLLKY